jgi:hypothetical protein
MWTCFKNMKRKCAADFYEAGKNTDISVSPPKVLAQNILATPDLPFPPLRGIVEVPVLRPDGSILADPGYDPATKLYYQPQIKGSRETLMHLCGNIDNYLIFNNITLQ